MASSVRSAYKRADISTHVTASCTKHQIKMVQLDLGVAGTSKLELTCAAGGKGASLGLCKVNLSAYIARYGLAEESYAVERSLCSGGKCGATEEAVRDFKLIYMQAALWDEALPKPFCLCFGTIKLVDLKCQRVFEQV